MEIRTIKDGEKITEPGFYNIPLSVHHGQPCDGVSVTSGILRTMETATPADVWAFHALNPDRWEKKETDALRLGVAMALYVEGGRDAVLTGFKVHADDKPRRPTEAQRAKYDAGEGTDAGILSVEYWDAVDADPHGYLDPAEFDLICTMGGVLERDPGAAAVMGGLPEVTMAWQDEITGLWVLSRPDTVSLDGSAADYKKMNTMGRPFDWRVVDQRITQHRYDMQMALAAEGLERLTGTWPGSVAIVAQWDARPHHVILREIAEQELREGQFCNRRALDTFASCLANDYWPGPGDDMGFYQRPDWLREKIQNEMHPAEAA